MREFRPTRPPRGRLVRLGVVLDTRNDPRRLCEVATMCDRARIDALWVRDHGSSAEDPRLEALTALTLSGLATSHSRLGAIVNPGLRPPAMLAAVAGTMDVTFAGRLELGLGDDAGAWDGDRLRHLEAYATIVRDLLAGAAVTAHGPFVLDDATIGVPSPQPGGPRLGLEAMTPEHVAVAVRVADDVLIPARPVAAVVATAREIVRVCESAGRPAQSLGIGAILPVSVGRTTAEAHARADAEPYYRVFGHPAEVGIFGRLEECQDQLVTLAHGGVTDLRCVLPNSPDVHDVIAQLTSMVVGSTTVLSPDSPRSKAPDPPPWSGGPRALTP